MENKILNYTYGEKMQNQSQQRTVTFTKKPENIYSIMIRFELEKDNIHSQDFYELQYQYG